MLVRAQLDRTHWFNLSKFFMGCISFMGTAMLGVLTTACHEAPASAMPSVRPPPRPAPVLSEDDEALLASLLADDPSDFYGARARIWRIGPAQWIADGPELPQRPNQGLRDAALDQPLEVVVIDEAGPRVLLPLGDLERNRRAPSWPALRLVAVLGPGDLVAGLAHELRPTPWLTLAAGVALTPIEQDQDELRVRWSDPACGFGLALAIDADEFGPVYEPGPSGRPVDEPEPSEGPTRRLAPGTQIYADAAAQEPIVRLDTQAANPSDRLSALTAMRVRLIGAPTRKLQQISLRCRGVVIEGYVPSASIVEIPGRYAIVDPEPPQSSSCAGFDADPILVPRATALYEPSADPALVGVVAEDVELAAKPGADGWWQSCVASPWGDLLFEFRLR